MENIFSYQVIINEKGNKPGQVSAQQNIIPKRKRQNKYGNVRTTIDGVSFASKAEAQAYNVLAALLKSKLIAGFCMQPKFILTEGNNDLKAITYKADFIIFHNGQIKPAGTYDLVDIKGLEHREWKRTYKMFQLKYPDLLLQVIKRLQYKTPKFYDLNGR
jgi:hypothetical protein